MRILSKSWLLWLGLLSACAVSSPAVYQDPDPPEVVDSWEEGCKDEWSLVLLCREDGDECGFFICRDVVPREVLLAYRGGGTTKSNVLLSNSAWSTRGVLSFIRSLLAAASRPALASSAPA